MNSKQGLQEGCESKTGQIMKAMFNISNVKYKYPVFARVSSASTSKISGRIVTFLAYPLNKQNYQCAQVTTGRNICSKQPGSYSPGLFRYKVGDNRHLKNNKHSNS
jgi:hypothetical protein